MAENPAKTGRCTQGPPTQEGPGEGRNRDLVWVAGAPGAKKPHWIPIPTAPRPSRRLGPYLAGYLKAIWPGLVGCVFEVCPAPGGPGSPSKRWGAKPPTFLKAPRAPGAGQTSTMHPNKSGQTASRYPPVGVSAAEGTTSKDICV